MCTLHRSREKGAGKALRDMLTVVWFGVFHSNALRGTATYSLLQTVRDSFRMRFDNHGQAGFVLHGEASRTELGATLAAGTGDRIYGDVSDERIHSIEHKVLSGGGKRGKRPTFPKESGRFDNIIRLWRLPTHLSQRPRPHWCPCAGSPARKLQERRS